MAQFQEKVALVTGSASGIGQKTARLYAREGARVVVSDVDKKGGSETVNMIKSDGGEAIFVEADVSLPEDCENLVQSSVSEFGQLDFACNNAGIAGERNPTADYTIEGWQRRLSSPLETAPLHIVHNKCVERKT